MVERRDHQGIAGELVVLRLGRAYAQHLSHRGPGGGGVTRMGRDPQAGLGRAAERRVIAPDRGHLRPRAAPEKHLETAYRELLF